MGTEVEVYLDAVADPDVLGHAEHEFHRLEALLSRFRPDSELSRLNRAGVMCVGPELLEVTALALGARERTHGRFDPTVHDALVAAGYDRTFALLGSDGGSTPVGSAPPPCGGKVTVDATTSTVAIEEGFRLDLGGIAKGWAVDRVLARLARFGPALVNAGGDLAGAGRPFPVGVDTADGTITLELEDGALATSGRDRRTWGSPAGDLHHLVDPSTGLPDDGDLLRVTVHAGTATEAEVLATSLFLAGDLRRARAEADEQATPAVLVGRDGSTVFAGGLE
jgi:thiamine biosynthesis lipoprotein